MRIDTVVSGYHLVNFGWKMEASGNKSNGFQSIPSLVSTLTPHRFSASNHAAMSRPVFVWLRGSRALD
jgi:hypothetical protein